MAAVYCLLFIISSPQAAISLGEAQVQSYLGQALRVRIPVQGLDSVNTQDPKCFQIGVPRNEDDLPLVLGARHSISTNPPALTIQSNRKVDDPIVQLSVTVDCGPKFQRDYVLLIDPQNEKTEVSPFPPKVNSEAGLATNPLTVLRTSQPEGMRGVVPSETNWSPPKPQQDNNRLARNRSSAPPIHTSELNNSRAAAKATKAQDNQIKGNKSALRLSDGLHLNQAERVVFSSPILKLSNDLSEPKLQTDTANLPKEVNSLQQARLALLRQRLRSSDADRDLDLSQGVEAELLVTQKRLEELQARLALLQAQGIPADAKLGVKSDVKGDPPSNQVKTVGEGNANSNSNLQPTAQPADGWAKVLNWVWLPSLLIGVLGLCWLIMKLFAKPPKSDVAEFESAIDEPPQATFAAVEHSPDQAPSSPTVGGFVNTKRMGEKTIMRKFSEEQLGPQTGKTDQDLAAVDLRHNQDLDLGLDFHPKGSLENMGVEIATITEEASVYAELGRKQEAIDILRDHIELEQAYDKATPAPWLMLIDLYHQTKETQSYEEVRQLFMRRFNGQIPTFKDYDSTAATRPLLDYPHVVERICLAWGEMTCNELLSTLMQDDREGNRLGFSIAAYRDLILLAGIHNNLLGSKPASRSFEPPLTKLNLSELQYIEVDNPTLIGGPITLSSLKPKSRLSPLTLRQLKSQ